MTTLLQDLRLGLRLFQRQPGFALVAVLVLGLGIAANTTIFSLVNALVLKPRLGAGDELVAIYSKNRTEPDSFRAFSYDNFSDLRSRKEIFASLTAHQPALVGISEGDATRRAFIDITSADLFDTFDLPLLMGRAFTREEERPRADIPVAIISHLTWERMGKPLDAIGRTVRINQRDFTIVGIAPEGFSGTITMVTPELWVPTGMYESLANDFANNRSTSNLADRRHHALILFGRLRDGVTLDTAGPLLSAASAWMESAYPIENKDQELTAGPLSRFSVSTSPNDDSAVSILAVSLLAMSGIVLLVASLNLANMQLARAGARRKEFAIRLAIGGSRFRLVRLLLTEGLVLAAAGGAVAIFASWVAMRALLSGMSGLLPVLITIDPSPDWRIFVATLAFAVAGTMMSSLGPALASARTDVLPELKEHAGEMKVSRARFATRNLLVMGQLALSLALLTTAGAFIRAAAVAAKVDPGFSFDRGILVNLDASLANFDQTRATALYGQVVDRLRQVPGITHVGFGTQMPFGDIREGGRVQKSGPVITAADPNYATMTASTVTMGITPDYFQALGLSLVRGRDFTDGEWRSAGGAPVGIIDQALASHLFGLEDPIGRLVQTSPKEDGSVEVIEVVGVAPDIRHQMEDDEAGPHLYRPYAQNFRFGVYVHAQTTNAEGEAAMLPALRAMLRDIDPNLPVVTLETGPMFRERNAMLWIIRTGATLFGVFGAVALFMAALGIYGVKAYLVARRTREFGIRLALGATSRDVVSLVMRDGLALTTAGLILGLGLSALVVRAIGGFVYGGGGFDLPIVAAAFASLFVSAIAATWIPARRATRIAPSLALRLE